MSDTNETQAPLFKSPEPYNPSNEPDAKEDSREVKRENVAPTKLSKSDAPKPKVVEEDKPQSYVWLADGRVLRANDEDLPGPAGHGNAHGHWQDGDKVYQIVAVYPVEIDVKG